MIPGTKYSYFVCCILADLSNSEDFTLEITSTRRIELANWDYVRGDG